MGRIIIGEQATPATPGAGFVTLFPKSDHVLYMIDENGVETVVATLPVTDTSTIVKGSVDSTKQVRFEVDSLTTETIRVITVPDKDITLDNDGDSRPPSNHASDHINGTDDIQNATNAQKGLATAAHITAVEANTAKTGVTTQISNIVEDITPQLGNQLEVGEYDIKLDSLLSADGKYSGITCDGILGATLAFGDLVYLNTTDQRWELTDANAETTSGDVILAIVLAAGNDGDTRLLLLQGFIREDDWNFTSYGQALFISCTAGDMTATVPSATGDIVRVIGYTSTFADQIYFNPSKTWLEIS